MHRERRRIPEIRQNGHDLLPLFVQLTNYGNGTAFDVRLTGTNCAPRVWAGDTPVGAEPQSDPDAVPSIGVPMWSESLNSLGPGESVTIFVMRPPTKNSLVGEPELTASWPRLA